MESFCVTSGTIIGAAHSSEGRPNQDSCLVRKDDNVVVAVVSDGCGSGEASQIGSRFISDELVKIVYDYVRRYLCEEKEESFPFWAEVTHDIVQRMRASLECLSGDAPTSESALALRAERFMCATAGVLIMTPKRSFIAYFGDGCFAVNGVMTTLDAANTPAYLAYHLYPHFDWKGHGMQSVFQQVWSGETSEVENIFIASDGVSSLWFNANDKPSVLGVSYPPLASLLGRVTEHEKSVQDFLREINSVKGDCSTGPLKDDTTMVLVRRCN